MQVYCSGTMQLFSATCGPVCGKVFSECNCRTEPLPNISNTLASICHHHHHFLPASSTGTGHWSATTPHVSLCRTHWGKNKSQAQRLHPSKGFAGKSQNSDSRGYASLEQLLGSDWDDPADLARPQVQSACVQPESHFIRYGMSVGSHSSAEPRTHSIAIAQTQNMNSCSLHHGACNKSCSKPQPVASEIQERLLNDFNLALDNPLIPEEWNTMLAQASGQPDKPAKAMHTDENMLSQSSKLANSRMKGPDTGIRPSSPLRPGVYVGHNAHQQVFANPQKIPGGIPTNVTLMNIRRQPSSFLPRPQSQGLNPPNSAPSTFCKAQLSAKTWMMHLDEEVEDEQLAEEKRQYDAWKKKVIECARNLDFEVSRFRTNG